MAANIRSALVLVLSCFVASLSLKSQEAAPIPAIPQLRARGLDPASSQSLLVDAVVTDDKGQPVRGLTRDKFRLLDNNSPVPPVAWQLLTTGTPVSQSPQVLFVLDAINASLPEMARAEAGLESYLQKSSAPLAHRTSILFVSDTPPPAADRPTTGNTPDTAATMALEQRKLFVHRTLTTTDRSALLQALRDYKPGLPRTNNAQGAAVHGDQVRLSLQALSYIASAYTPIKGPKLLVWLGPGWPFLAQSAAKSSEAVFDSVIYFNHTLQEAQITLYSIIPEGVTAGDASSRIGAFEMAQHASSSRSIGAAPPPEIPSDLGDTFYGNFLHGVRNISQSNQNDLDLQVLAIHSGGLVLRKNNDLVAQIEHCVADADAIYVFSYTPAKDAHPDTYHDLAVKTTSTPATVRTLTGFYSR